MREEFIPNALSLSTVVRCFDWIYQHERNNADSLVFGELLVRAVLARNDVVLDRLLALDVCIDVSSIQTLTAQVIVDSSLLPPAARIIHQYLIYGHIDDIRADVNLLCVDAARAGDVLVAIDFYQMLTSNQKDKQHTQARLLEAASKHANVIVVLKQYFAKEGDEDASSWSSGGAALSLLLETVSDSTVEESNLEKAYDSIEQLCRQNNEKDLSKFMDGDNIKTLLFTDPELDMRAKQLLVSFIGSEVSLPCIQLFYKRVSVFF